MNLKKNQFYNNDTYLTNKSWINYKTMNDAEYSWFNYKTTDDAEYSWSLTSDFNAVFDVLPELEHSVW